MVEDGGFPAGGFADGDDAIGGRIARLRCLLADLNSTFSDETREDALEPRRLERHHCLDLHDRRRALPMHDEPNQARHAVLVLFAR